MLIWVISFGCSTLMGSKSETMDSSEDSPSEGVDTQGIDNGETGRMIGMTEAHNVIRRTYDVPDLIWDTELVTVSEEWIVHLAQTGCNLEHNWDSPLGENLFWSNYQETYGGVVDSWASEVEYYDYTSNSCATNQMCGHFTQLVWSTTERVGCAVGACPDGSEIWMCNYDPPGNYSGVWPY